MNQQIFRPEDGITDADWQELIARASGGGQRFFTENQLYLAYARNKVTVTRHISRRGLLGLCILVIGITAWVYGLKWDAGLTLVFGIALTLGGDRGGRRLWFCRAVRGVARPRSVAYGDPA